MRTAFFDSKVQVLASMWTVNQRKYMEWLATPSVDRWPLFAKTLADELGVNEATLYKWRKHPGFAEEVQRLITESLGDAYHDVMSSFKAEARKGSFPHQRMYFEMMGLYVPKSQVDHNHNHRLMLDEVERIAVQEGWDEGQKQAAVEEAERIFAGKG